MKVVTSSYVNLSVFDSHCHRGTRKEIVSVKANEVAPTAAQPAIATTTTTTKNITITRLIREQVEKLKKKMKSDVYSGQQDSRKIAPAIPQDKKIAATPSKQKQKKKEVKTQNQNQTQHKLKKINKKKPRTPNTTTTTTASAASTADIGICKGGGMACIDSSTSPVMLLPGDMMCNNVEMEVLALADTVEAIAGPKNKMSRYLKSKYDVDSTYSEGMTFGNDDDNDDEDGMVGSLISRSIFNCTEGCSLEVDTDGIITASEGGETKRGTILRPPPPAARTLTKQTDSTAATSLFRSLQGMGEEKRTANETADTLNTTMISAITADSDNDHGIGGDTNTERREHLIFARPWNNEEDYDRDLDEEVQLYTSIDSAPFDENIWINFGVEKDDDDFAPRVAGVTDHNDNDDDTLFDAVDDDDDVDIRNIKYPGRVRTVLASNIEKNKTDPKTKDFNAVTTGPTAESVTSDVNVETIRSKLSAKKEKSSLLSSLLATSSKYMKKNEEVEEVRSDGSGGGGGGGVDEEKKAKNYREERHQEMKSLLLATGTATSTINKEKRYQDMKSLLLATGTATSTTKSSRSILRGKGREEDVKQSDDHQDEKIKVTTTMNKTKKSTSSWRESIVNVGGSLFKSNKKSLSSK
ncbi:hypothetical protein FRACYDRAFT_246268 [Fragilariopsis cylindrus CCMP1102]|uniref:Uncharacterized protein n=1 Tax=Fragilariopsis cylindrus CCMP1102 TaxID=635003 RepID=A0A1E7EZ62_9STRA|nr:hypothetical protein FRACYDRAFT_246268 [Fragilariopsis cylindrus CCMP1102]|eukprot:OEU11157.1 hypothetical protein FRACYDRAFT_246268 [Fragilariopsis cylindrus CCMP1102]